MRAQKTENGIPVEKTESIPRFYDVVVHVSITPSGLNGLDDVFVCTDAILVQNHAHPEQRRLLSLLYIPTWVSAEETGWLSFDLGEVWILIHYKIFKPLDSPVKTAAIFCTISIHPGTTILSLKATLYWRNKNQPCFLKIP